MSSAAPAWKRVPASAHAAAAAFELRVEGSRLAQAQRAAARAVSPRQRRPSQRKLGHPARPTRGGEFWPWHPPACDPCPAPRRPSNLRPRVSSAAPDRGRSNPRGQSDTAPGAPAASRSRGSASTPPLAHAGQAPPPPRRHPGYSSSGAASLCESGHAVCATLVSMRRARPCTRAPETFLRARRTMRSNVWRETPMRCAASSW